MPEATEEPTTPNPFGPPILAAAIAGDDAGGADIALSLYPDVLGRAAA